jgi:tetratricopeptide (TPR) repeat protein
MKTIHSIILSFLFSLHLASAQTFVEQFESLKKSGDRPGMEKLLSEAAKTEAGNPDYYATAGNYWWGQSQAVEIPALEAGEYQLDPKDLSIKDPKTGKKLGAIGQTEASNPETSKRALSLLREGATKFPLRADIALGLVHVEKEMGLQQEYVKSLMTLLATAKADAKKLQWTKGGALPSAPEKFLPETVQTYSAALFNSNTPKTDELCATLLNGVTDAFPNHPYAYNLKAALADAGGKPEEALKMLETAHEKAPTDALILSNLASSYAKAKKDAKAISAYEKLLELKPNAKTRQKAEAALKKLKEAN